MDYNFTVEQKGDYLLVKVEGENTPNNVAKYLSEVLNTCMQYNCYKVLIEENLLGSSIGTLDMFNVVKNAANHPMSAKIKIAYIDINKEHNMSDLLFGETVAVNRAVNVKIFSDYNDAKNWLQNSDKPIQKKNE
jgi:hypothetical protein